MDLQNVLCYNLFAAVHRLKGGGTGIDNTQPAQTDQLTAKEQENPGGQLPPGFSFAHGKLSLFLAKPRIPHSLRNVNLQFMPVPAW